MTDNKLNISELDYKNIKENLRQFLEDNPVFNSYNFEGSALDVLNSQLAYNTHYLAFYAHMLFNEAFLDTAVKRESVVSHAKQLNYTPKSISASTAVLNINITPTTTPVDITIPKGYTFTGTKDNKSYEFQTIEEVIATPTGVGNTYRAENVSIVQGQRTQIAFVKNIADPTQRFVLPFSDIDTKYLIVTIQNEEGDTTNSIWEYKDSIIDIDGESEVYFLQEAEDGRFELKFGDGIFGKELKHGNVIIVDYLRTGGKDANGISVFSPSGSLGGTNAITVETVQSATGGADVDDIEFIKKIAPRIYESQKRCVTARDYETFLLNNTDIIADNFSSVQVWGGEDNEPKLYGNVLISLKPKNGVVLTSFLKNKVLELLDSVNPIGIIPIIVDAEYLYLELDISVDFVGNKTTKTRDEIVDDVRQLTLDYRDNILSFFNKTFHYSELSCLINDSDSAIISNLIDIRLKRYETLLFNQIQNYTIEFRNPIKEGSLKSAKFFVSETFQDATDKYFFEDDENGNVVLKKISLDNTISIINANAGIINYQTGEIKLDNFVPVNLIDDTDFWLSVKPQINDIETVRNLIITFDEKDLNVSANRVDG